MMYFIIIIFLPAAAYLKMKPKHLCKPTFKMPVYNFKKYFLEISVLILNLCIFITELHVHLKDYSDYFFELF